MAVQKQKRQDNEQERLDSKQEGHQTDKAVQKQKRQDSAQERLNSE